MSLFPLFIRSSFAKLALCMLFMLPLANIFGVHFSPQTTLTSEMAAVIMVGLLMFACCGIEGKSWIDGGLAKQLLFPLGMVGVLVLQGIFLTFPYAGNFLTPLLVFALAALGLFAIQLLKKTLDAENLMLWLAWGCVASGLLNFLAGMAQWLEYTPWEQSTYFSWLYAVINRNGIWGFFAQKNQFANFMMVAACASAYLAAQRKLSIYLAIPILLGFSFVMTLTGSRSVLLYLIGISVYCVGVFFTMRWQLRRAGSIHAVFIRRFSSLIFVLILSLLLMQFALPVINRLCCYNPTLGDVFTPLSRVFPHLQIDALNALFGTQNQFSDIPNPIGLTNGARRLVEWEKSAMMLTSHPWLGVGWGSYPYHSFALQYLPAFRGVVEEVIFTNAHNLFAQLCAETGLLGAGIVLAWLLFIAWQLLTTPLAPRKIFAVCALIVMLGHSMVEFPLWYLHNLFLAIAISGLAIDAEFKKNISLRGTQFVLCASSFTAWVLAVLTILSYALVWTQGVPHDISAKLDRAEAIRLNTANPLFANYTEPKLLHYLAEDDPAYAVERLAIAKRAYLDSPGLGAIQRYSKMLLQQSPHNKQAVLSMFRLAVGAYPEGSVTTWHNLQASPQPIEQQQARLFEQVLQEAIAQLQKSPDPVLQQQAQILADKMQQTQ